MISGIAFKIGFSLFLVVVCLLLIDAPSEPNKSPAWIAITGGASAVVGLLCMLVGGIAMIWGF